MAHRVAFSLFGFPIYWYGLLIALGVTGGTLLAVLREKRLGLQKDTALDFLMLALPLAIVCARLYYVFFAWDSYAASPLSVFNLREGGLAIYGGVIGGIAAALIFSRRRHISFGTLADLCAPSLALGQAVGRWGNFFNQEAYGIPLRESLSFFPLSVFIEADGVWHAATFFYESVWCVIICLVLLLLENRRFFRRKGDLFGLYVLLYGAERAVVEGFRTDSLMLGALRVSQLLSVCLMLGVLIVLLRRPCDLKKRLFVLAGVAALAFALLFIRLSYTPGQIISAAAVIAAGMLAYTREPLQTYNIESCD